jgi:hypothetical protein
MPIDPTMTKEPGSDKSKKNEPIEVSSLGLEDEDPLDDAVIGLDEDDLEGPREPENE